MGWDVGCVCVCVCVCARATERVTDSTSVCLALNALLFQTGFSLLRVKSSSPTFSVCWNFQPIRKTPFLRSNTAPQERRLWFHFDGKPMGLFFPKIWYVVLVQTRQSWAQRGREAEYIISRRVTESAGEVLWAPPITFKNTREAEISERPKILIYITPNMLSVVE